MSQQHLPRAGGGFALRSWDDYIQENEDAIVRISLECENGFWSSRTVEGEGWEVTDYGDTLELRWGPDKEYWVCLEPFEWPRYVNFINHFLLAEVK